MVKVHRDHRIRRNMESTVKFNLFLRFPICFKSERMSERVYTQIQALLGVVYKGPLACPLFLLHIFSTAFKVLISSQRSHKFSKFSKILKFSQAFASSQSLEYHIQV